MAMLPDPWRSDAVAVTGELLNMAAYSTTSEPVFWAQHLKNRLKSFESKWVPTKAPRLKLPGMKGLGMYAAQDGVLGAVMVSTSLHPEMPYATLKKALIWAAWGWKQKSVPMAAAAQTALHNYEAAAPGQASSRAYAQFKAEILATAQSKKIITASFAPNSIKWALAKYEAQTGLKGLGDMDMESGPGRTYRDGVLGSMAMASGPGRTFQDGVLGGCATCGIGNLNDSAFRDGSLGDYLSAYRDGSLGELDLKNPLLWAGVGVAALGAFLLLKGGKKKMKSNRRQRRNKRRARRR